MEIGILGFGRFGQFLAKILKKKNKIYVYDIIKKRSKMAEKLGVSFLNLEEILKKKLIILAIPISEMENVLKKIKDKVGKGQIIMDVLSVKEYPVSLMKRYLPQQVEILASHPLFGPDSAKEGLEGLQIVFYPLRIKEKNLKKIKKMFRGLKLKIIEATPQEHDRQTALSLCLVHFIGRALEEMKLPSLKMTTLGYQKLISVFKMAKNDSLKLFQDIQKYNRFAKIYRQRFLKALLKLNKLIQGGDKDG